MKKRNLSEFMCIEMLYDYKTGNLDPLRKQAVEESLQESPRAREELRRLTVGMSYTDKLQKTIVTQPLVDYILHQPKPTEKFFSKFHWDVFPQPVRWALESIVVAVAIALFVTQAPELFKAIGKKEDGGLVIKKFDIQSIETKEGLQPEAPASKVAEKQAEPEKEILPSKPLVMAPTPSAEPVAQPQTKLQEASQASAQVEAAEKKVKKGNAYLYRMVMQSTNVEGVTPQVVTLIQSLGGEKAGEVELGWRRKGGSYFHFSLPKEANQTFLDSLKKIGQFSISKTSHPRIMPEDKERFILWINELKPEGNRDQPGADENKTSTGASPEQNVPENMETD